MCTFPSPPLAFLHSPRNPHNHHQLTLSLLSRRILLGLRPRQTPRQHLLHRLPLRPDHRPTLHRRLLLRHPPNPNHRPLRARQSPPPDPRPKGPRARRKAQILGPDGRGEAAVQGRRAPQRVSR